MTRTLHIYIGTHPDRSDLQEDLVALDAGEDVDARPSQLSFDSLAAFNRVFRPTNLELLEALADNEPDSIRELARLVDRHPPEVTENVHELANHGLVELEDHGAARRPRLWYDEIEIRGDVPLAGSGDTGESEVTP
jgi:predicted transcriptional regulator